MFSAANIKDQLHQRRGDWPTLCRVTGLSYWWLTKFAQGRIKEPGLSKVERLVAYFDAHPVGQAPAPQPSEGR